MITYGLLLVIMVSLAVYRNYCTVQGCVGRGDIVSAKARIARDPGVLTRDATLLHLAVRNDHSEMVVLLLDRGANVNATDGDYDTPLHLALREKNVRMARILIARGAKVNLRNGDGDTPLLMLCELLPSRAPQVARDLVSKGADVDLKNKGETPLGLLVRGMGTKQSSSIIRNQHHKSNAQKGASNNRHTHNRAATETGHK
jgi:ankyrin repeat protein